ncbi:hypothetical protein TPHA_0J01110 [Tetrapisispora phaffii CBS 4417]|uniref:TMEM205-like domain-containing protein n=1 Tax=Tetrapisispora phaffii (strain ATCC 24235 / CBS 4417 / NBRC 1672 / NRRL Y-8282 / UCD 70-5) TaxID=1071381 RepID=G8BYJ1_TETPH|nr:hypothetical protein TPHA_0J01110 [Tetrapisispora phaffii CBS 4417]CCE64933.1 hypothetical protein TPHA_0J01110 [Tetrapisispora phaffii CBS 4417]
MIFPELFKPTAHLLFYSFAFGGTLFYSKVASIVAYRTLEREQFSELQNHMFPQLFRLETLAPIILAFTAPYNVQPGAYHCLIAAFASGLINLVALLPWAKKVKLERKELAKKFEGEELEKKDAPLKKSFGKVHLASVILNTVHIILMGTYGYCLTKALYY